MSVAESPRTFDMSTLGPSVGASRVHIGGRATLVTHFVVPLGRTTPQTMQISVWLSDAGVMLASTALRRRSPGFTRVGSMAEYVAAALQLVSIEEMEDGEGYFISIPRLPGVWGSGQTTDQALEELRAGVVGWVALAQQRNIPIPPFGGIIPPRYRTT